MLQQAPKSCCCLNVKVGSTILATLFLLIGFFGTLQASYALFNINSVDDSVEPISMNNETSFYTFTFTQSKGLTYGLNLAVSFCIVVIAILALHGISKSKPSCLAPLIVVQAVIVLRTVIMAFNFMIHWSSVRLMIAACKQLPDDTKLWLMNLNDPSLGALVFGLFLLALFIKTYFIVIMIRCYEHLKAERLSLQSESNPGSTVEKAKVEAEELPQYKDIQKCPLVTELDEVSVTPPEYTA